MGRRLAATLLLAAVVAAGSGGAARASFPAAHQRLVLVSETGGFAMPSLLRPGADPFLVGLPVGVRGTAAVSPEGTRVALVATAKLFPEMTPVPQLLVGYFAGGGSTFDLGPVSGRASWSPEGTRLAIAAKPPGTSSWDVYVVDASGNGTPVDLTPSSPADDLEPRWSSDGAKIAFESDRTGNLDVFTMNPDGSAVTDLTGDPAADTLGDWAPDSQRLVFSSSRSGNGDLYTVSRDGGAVTQLTSGPGADTHAAWSPDGALIAYSNDGGGDTEAFTVHPDGSSTTQLTDDWSEDLVQDWQALKDVVAPVVHALPSSGRRGRPMSFRFRIAESSGRAAVDLEFGYSTKHGGEGVETSRTYTGLRSGRVYQLTFPADELSHLPVSVHALRFCVRSIDGSANEGKRSCAWFRFVAKKKRA